MAEYRQKHDEPNVIIELANPDGVIDLKKDSFTLINQHDFAAVLFDENDKLLGICGHMPSAKISQQYFKGCPKPGLFKSKMKGSLFFMRKSYMKEQTTKWPIHEITPPADTRILWKDGKYKNPVFGTVKLSMEIYTENIIRELKKGGAYKPEDGVVFTESNMIAVCQGCLKAALGGYSFNEVDVMSRMRIADKSFNLSAAWSSGKDFTKDLNYAMAKINEKVFPNCFRINVINSGYNY